MSRRRKAKVRTLLSGFSIRVGSETLNVRIYRDREAFVCERELEVQRGDGRIELVGLVKRLEPVLRLAEAKLRAADEIPGRSGCFIRLGNLLGLLHGGFGLVADQQRIGEIQLSVGAGGIEGKGPAEEIDGLCRIAGLKLALAEIRQAGEVIRLAGLLAAAERNGKQQEGERSP